MKVYQRAQAMLKAHTKTRRIGVLATLAYMIGL